MISVTERLNGRSRYIRIIAPSWGMSGVRVKGLGDLMLRALARRPSIYGKCAETSGGWYKTLNIHTLCFVTFQPVEGALAHQNALQVAVGGKTSQCRYKQPTEPPPMRRRPRQVPRRNAGPGDPHLAHSAPRENLGGSWRAVGRVVARAGRQRATTAAAAAGDVGGAVGWRRDPDQSVADGEAHWYRPAYASVT